METIWGDWLLEVGMVGGESELWGDDEEVPENVTFSWMVLWGRGAFWCVLIWEGSVVFRKLLDLGDL